jgi:hypothetical protein
VSCLSSDTRSQTDNFGSEVVGDGVEDRDDLRDAGARGGELLGGAGEVFQDTDQLSHQMEAAWPQLDTGLRRGEGDGGGGRRIK